MPDYRHGTQGKIGSVPFLVGFIGSIVMAFERQLQVALLLLLPMALGMLLIWLDKGRWPPGIATLGDLADRVAVLDDSQLGDVRDLPDSIWRR